MRRILFLLSIFWGAYNPCATAQWKPTNGPYGGKVNCFLNVKTDGKEVVYFGSDGAGVFRSSDNGLSWSVTRNGLPQTAKILSLAAKGDTLYAGTAGNGMYYSANRGEQWSLLESSSTDLVYGFGILEMHPVSNALYVTIANTSSDIYRSVDHGKSWTYAGEGLPPYTGLEEPERLKYLKTDGSRYWILEGGRLYFSTDGLSWTHSKGLPQKVKVEGYAVRNNVVIASTEAGVYYSNDGGASWVGSGVPAGTFIDIDHFVSAGDTLLALTDAGLYLSVDKGTAWINVAGYISTYPLHYFGKSGNAVLAATPSGVYRSTNNGATWEAVKELPADVSVIDFVSSDSGLLAVTSSGLYRSTDNGAGWAPPAGIAGNVSVSDFIRSGTRFLTVTSAGVYHSADNGATWSAVEGMPADVSIYEVRVVDFPGGKEGFLALTSSGVYRSVDNGAGWTAVRGMPAGTSAISFVSSGTVLLAIAASGFWPDQVSGIYRSTDEGATWKPAKGIPARVTDITNLTISSTNVLVNTSSGVYRSVDNGAGWTAVRGIPAGISVFDFIRSGGSFLAVTSEGVYRSTDNGAAWKPVKGIPPDRRYFIRSGDAFLAVTASGIYRSTDDGASWTAVKGIPGGSNITDFITSEDGFLAVTFAGVYRSADSGATWEAVKGIPPGTGVKSLTRSGSSLLAVTSNGVYHSADNGADWALAKGIPANVQAVGSLLSKDGKILAGTDKGVYQSADHGVTWTPLLKVGPWRAGITIKGIEKAGNTLLTVTSSGICHSADGGATWETGINGLQHVTVTDLISSGNSWLAIAASGFYHSADNGATWALAKGIPADTDFTEPAFIRSGNSLLAVTYPGLYRSTDDGATWAVAEGIPDGTTVSEFDFISSGNSLLMVHYLEAHCSVDQGATWKPVKGIPSHTTVNHLIASGTSLVAATPAGIYRSTDEGANWKEVKGLLTGLTATGFIGSDTSLLAATGSGIYRSADHGASWEAAKGFPADISVRWLVGSGNSLVAASSAGIYRSTDGGAGWEAVKGNGLTALLPIDRLFIIDSHFFALSDNAIYHAMGDAAAWKLLTNVVPARDYISNLVVSGKSLLADASSGIYRSADYGATWKPVTAMYANYSVYTLMGSGTGLLASAAAGVYRSVNGGDAWMPVQGIPAGYTINSFLVSGSTWLAGAGRGLYQSGDEGKTWTMVTDFPEYRLVNALAESGQNLLAATPEGLYYTSEVNSAWKLSRTEMKGTVLDLVAINELLFARTEYGIFRSADGGRFWYASNRGLPTDLSWISGIAAAGDMLFAWTFQEVYRSVDGGVSWVLTGNGLPESAGISHVAGRGNAIYLASGLGLFQSIDGGNKWLPNGNDPSGDEGEGGTLFGDKVFVLQGNIFISITEGIFLRSTDKGQTWQSVEGLPTSKAPICEDIVLDESTNTLYLGAKHLENGSGLMGGMYRSADGGASWQEVTNPSPTEALEKLAVYGGNLLACYPGGLYRSADGGNTWTLLAAAGLPPDAALLGVMVSENRLYASLFNNGVWALPLEDLYVRITGATHPDSALARYNEANALVLDENAPTPAAALRLNQYPAGTQVKLFTRGVTRRNWQSQVVASAATAFSAPLPREQFDELGLEYYFEVTPPAGYGPAVYSDTLQVGLRFRDGINLPALPSGRELKDYRLISIPLALSDNRAARTFDELGGPDRMRWRLVGYNQDNARQKPDSAWVWDDYPDLEPGKSYWFVGEHAGKVLNSGDGITLRARPGIPFRLTLTPGWNAVGNPYLFRLAWADVLKASGNPEGVGKLKVYRGAGYEPTDTLVPFAGGFVYYEGDQPVSLQFPVERSGTPDGGRRGVEAVPHDSTSHFETNFTLSGAAGLLRIGGLGMHDQAKTGADPRDDYNPPRWP
ncbi:MAG: hypothetical protein ICV83_04625, partial [Cytophagales bacterium]|nr:hypothetical protein [Cytophagales bacterium]